MSQVLDGVLLEILRQRFQAIVEEMAQVVLHTGHTVFVKFTQDMGASLVTTEGELLAIPQLMGVNIITGQNMRRAIEAISDYQQGDVVISNDPFATGGMVTHLPDVFVWRPVFVGGQLLCFAAAFVHSSDVGGKVPGSVSATNTEIFQEGLRLPPLKLYRAGVLNEDIKSIFLANCRIPEQNWGDVTAMLSALDIAEVRMNELVNRYGSELVCAGIVGVLDYAERQVRAIIRELPNGKRVFWDYMEGDQFGWPPIRIKLTMDVRDDEIFCDFAGTEIEVRGAFNLPTFNMAGHYMLVVAFVNLFRTLNRNLPSNSGVVRPLHTYSPVGTLLNPEYPAAVGVRGATMYRVIDVAMATLGMARPDIVPAAGGGMTAIVLLSARDATSGKPKVSVLQPLNGGGGGRQGLDGTNATSSQGGWLRNIPNEKLEADMPVLIRKYALRPDSGGAGRFRGGHGVVFEFTVLAPSTTITARGMERYRFAPWGRDGGSHGAVGATLVKAVRDPQPLSVGKIDTLEVGPGDTVTYLTQGGGGLGDPLLRDVESVRADVDSGLLGVETATSSYGVVFTGGMIDPIATEAARRSIRDEREPLASYDFGPQRREYEALWPEELQSAITEMVLSQPRSWRAFYKDRLIEEIETRHLAGDRVSSTELPRLLAAIQQGSSVTSTGVAAAIEPQQEGKGVV